jgi:hypothetical protein
MNEKLRKKVSPPFEGGVVGKIDYHIFTVLYLPTGVVDYGRKFRREHNIGNLIAYFFCASEKLVIERDGNPHNNQPPRPVSGFVS